MKGLKVYIKHILRLNISGRLGQREGEESNLPETGSPSTGVSDFCVVLRGESFLSLGLKNWVY